MEGPGKFEDLFEAYKNMVYNRCMHYLVNEEDAQDATQEIFVKIYHNLEKYDARQSKLSTWISRITINFCIDLLRAKKKEIEIHAGLSIYQSTSRK